MYTEHFALTKKPFALTPDPDFLYLSPRHKKALTILQYGLMSQAGFTVVTGEIGSGKTTLISHLLNHIEDDCTVGLITNTHSSFGDLLTWVLAAFDIKTIVEDKAQRYQLLVDFLKQQFAKQRRAVLIVDEAQNMDLQTLEELRLLSNINSGSEIMLQLVLVGQPELVDKLRSPELIQFAQRISIEFHLTPLNYEQTEKYIYHRLKVVGGSLGLFTKTACAAVYYFTGGVPRLINNICDLAMVYAFAEDEETIELQTVLDVVKEKQAGGIVPLKAVQNDDAKIIVELIKKQESIDLTKYVGGLPPGRFT